MCNILLVQFPFQFPQYPEIHPEKYCHTNILFQVFLKILNYQPNEIRK